MTSCMSLWCIANDIYHYVNGWNCSFILDTFLHLNLISSNMDIFVSCGGNQSPKAAMQLHFALNSRPYSPKAVEDLAAITVLWGSNKHQPEGQVVGKVSVLVSAQNWKIKNTPMKSINTPFPCSVRFCFSSFYPPGKLPAKTKHENWWLEDESPFFWMAYFQGVC